MREVAAKLDPVPGIPYFGPARVLEHDQGDGRVRVLLGRTGGREKSHTAWARLATPYAFKPNWGDTLLVAGQEPDGYYVIGVLDGRTAESERTLALRNGSRAVVTGPPEAEKLTVLSRQGGLIFEYDAETGKSRVDIPEGDLEIITRKGDIAFTAAKGIRFHSEKPIEMESPEGIGLTTANDAGIKLKPNHVSLSGPAIGIRARRGDIRIEEARYVGNRLSGTITTVKSHSGTL